MTCGYYYLTQVNEVKRGIVSTLYTFDVKILIRHMSGIKSVQDLFYCLLLSVLPLEILDITASVT